MILDSTGLMLGRPADAEPTTQGRATTARPGPLVQVIEAPATANVAPTSYEYSAQNPEVERTQPYEDFSLGFGLQQQQAFVDKRYKFALGADLSTPGLWLKGPELTRLSPAITDTTNGVSGFFDLGGVVYALAGRYVLGRATDGSWPVSKDLNDYGAGTTALDVVTFYSNALAGNRAWVALSPSTEQFAYFDGTTWTQAAGADMDARAFAVVGREFYRARDTNLLTKCDTDADPTIAANWAAANAFRIGDKASAITRLYVNAAGVLVIVKTDGIYSIASDGQDIAYFPFLELAPSSDNGKGGGAFLNDLYLPFRSGLHRLTPSFGIQEAGPEQQNGTDWLAGMRTTAFLGHDTLHAYAGVTDETDSYLMKLLPSGVWHGSISTACTGVRITALHKSTVGAPSGHARLYLGFSDGSLGWLTLPNTVDPSADGDYTFSTDDAELHLPDFTAQIANDPKVLYALTVNQRGATPPAPGTTAVTLDYRLDPQVTVWTPLDNTFDVPRERADFAVGTSGTVVALRFTLSSTDTAYSTEVTGAGLHHVWAPARREIYRFNVLDEDGLTRWDNVPLRIGRTRIRQVLEGARDAESSVLAILPDHSSQQLVITQIGETIAFDDRTRQWRGAIEVRAVQFNERAVYGTHARLEQLGSHGAMEALGSHARMEQV